MDAMMNYALRRVNKARGRFVETGDALARQKLERRITFYAKHYFMVASPGKAQMVLRAGTAMVKVGTEKTEKNNALAEIKENTVRVYPAFARTSLLINGALEIISRFSLLPLALLSFFSKNPFIRGCLFDVFLAASIACVIGRKHIPQKTQHEKTLTYFRESGNLIAPAFSFVLGAIAELAQKFGLLPGTYDKHDFIAYALGAMLAYLVLNPFSYHFKILDKIRGKYGA